jgi:hypothetical protein
MSDDDDELDVDRLALRSSHFRRRVVELEPDQALSFDPALWRDTIVFLATGEIELECVSGELRRFPSGAILCLRLPLRTLRSCGGAPARLIAISRRSTG